MPNNRIPDSSLPDAFQLGDYLSPDDLNQIVTVFKNAINYNKIDMDKMLAANSDANIAYDLDTLYAFAGVEGDYAYLYNPELLGDGVKLYEYVSGSWIYRTKLSLIDLYERIADVPEIEQLRIDVDALQAVVDGITSNYGDVYTGYDTPDADINIWFDLNND